VKISYALVFFMWVLQLVLILALEKRALDFRGQYYLDQRDELKYRIDHGDNTRAMYSRWLTFMMCLSEMVGTKYCINNVFNPYKGKNKSDIAQ